MATIMMRRFSSLVPVMIFILVVTVQEYSIFIRNAALEQSLAAVEAKSREPAVVVPKREPMNELVITPSENLEASSARKNRTSDERYYQLGHEARMDELQKQMRRYMDQNVTCETKFVTTRMWCDTNPGNGLKQLLKTLVLGFILDRLPLISVHRKSSCEPHFLEFKKPHLFIPKEISMKAYLDNRQCSHIPPSVMDVSGGFPYGCRQLGNRGETFLDVSDMFADVAVLADIQFNPSLTDEQYRRTKRVFDIGTYTSVGLLMDLVFDISSKIKTQFLSGGDYFPGEEIMGKLINPTILKVGIHIRHLPFVVRDENGPDKIDKRALKCLGTAVSTAMGDDVAKQLKKYSGGCLVLLATDMSASRNEIAKRIESQSPSCATYVIKRTGNSSSMEEWGNASYSDWETRDSARDRRSMLEAYLDFFMLSEYSNVYVFGQGSTFSQLIGYRVSKRQETNITYEFACSSCKEQYLPYQCCQPRRRWNELILMAKNPLHRC